MSKMTSTEAFYAWERKGRGWSLAEYPALPEPPFVPFWAHYIETMGQEDSEWVDDGLKEGLLGFVARKTKEGVKGYIQKRKAKKLKKAQETEIDDGVTEEVRNTDFIEFLTEEGDDVVEMLLSFPSKERVGIPEMEQLLLILSQSKHPISFEVVATHEKIQFLLVCRESDAQFVYAQTKAFLPFLELTPTFHYLFDRLDFNELYSTAIVDYGLKEEFMRPLKMMSNLSPDPLVSLIAVMEHLGPGEFAMFQVIFQGAVNPWASSIIQSVTDDNGRSFFVDAPEMVTLARTKVSKPLMGVVIRTAARSHTKEATKRLSQNMARALTTFDAYSSNSLIKLPNRGYPYSLHMVNVMERQSHRLGMLLNIGELATIIHPPSPSISSQKIWVKERRTKLLPEIACQHPLRLGYNPHREEEFWVSISEEMRLRHMHLIGGTGLGKSTLLKSMIVQDIEQGNGLALLDPHGDLVDDILSRIPEERIKDVIVIDPSDSEYPVGINLLSAHSELDKVVLSSDLVSLFERFSKSWGDQMTSVLGNAIAAFMESTRGGTLLDLKRFLIEKKFRDDFLSSVEDPEVLYFWQHEFPLLRSNSIGSLTTRLSTFLRPKLIRNMMGQKEGLDFGRAMNDKKIILVKLAQGEIGEENSYILGTLIVAKIQQAAQARQRLPRSERTAFYLYADEFQHFITPSMKTILSGARKYGLGLILAHQDLDQVFKKDAELGNTLVSNAGTRICFRLGDFDAKKLESGFSYFEASDLMNLKRGETIMRIGSAANDFNMSTEMLEEVDEFLGQSTRDEVIAQSRQTYGGSAPEYSYPEIQTEKKEKKKKTPPAPPEYTPFEEIPEEKVKEEVVQPEPQVEESPAQDDMPSFESPPPPPLDSIEKAKEDFLHKEEKREEIREHRTIQLFIKALAESRGFKAVLEQQAGSGRVDVGLQKGELLIGIEISVTNSLDYEVKNIQKCLQAGYDPVFMLSKRAKHLENIRVRAAESISKKRLNKVHFLDPDDFHTVLDTYVQKEAPIQTTVIGGYQVSTEFSQVDEMERKQIEDSISDVVMKARRRRNK